MLPALPDEIKEIILVKLPAKSLVRFSLVQKRWQSLISDPVFIKKHLTHVLSDKSNNHRRLLINACPNFYSIDFDLHTFTKLHFPFESFPGVRIMGSCNGLVLVALLKRFEPSQCFVDYNYSDDVCNLALWNPIRGEFAFLPDCYRGTDIIPVVGFGYDSSADDYKVVRVVTNGPDVGPAGETLHRVEIYSRKTNSWRKIDDIPYYDPYLLCSILGGTLVDGTVYWLTNYEEGDEGWSDNLIFGFDFTKEEFKMLDIRKLEDIDQDLKRSLTVIDGRLGVCQTGYDSKNVRLWILKTDELNNEYWTTANTIEKPEGMHCNFACFTKNDEALFTVTDDKLCWTNKKLVLHDLINNDKRSVDFGARGAITVWSEEMIYVETLVSLNDGWSEERMHVEALMSLNGGKSS